MKTFWTLCFCLLAFTTFATSVPPRSLAELVADSDHIIVGKITKVDMVDAKGKPVTSLDARTGPGLPHTIRLNVTVETNGVLLTNSKQVPQTLTIPLWSKWHYSLGQIKEAEEGQPRIFLLTGPNFDLTYPISCSRPLSDRPQIEKIIKPRVTPKTLTAPASTVRIGAIVLRPFPVTNDGGRKWHTYIITEQEKWTNRGLELKQSLRECLEHLKQTLERGTLGLGIAIYINDEDAKERQHKIVLYSDSPTQVFYDTIYEEKIQQFTFPEDPKKRTELHFDKTSEDLIAHFRKNGIPCRLERNIIQGNGFRVTLYAPRSQYALHRLTESFRLSEKDFWQNGRFILTLDPESSGNILGVKSGGFFENEKNKQMVIKTLESL